MQTNALIDSLSAQDWKTQLRHTAKQLPITESVAALVPLSLHVATLENNKEVTYASITMKTATSCFNLLQDRNTGG